MSSVTVKEFNKILNEFISKMITTFPEQKKLKSYYRAFNVTKTYNSKLPIQLFMGGCVNFSEQIKSRDEDFFKKRDTFVDVCKNCSNFGTDTGIIDVWESLSDKTRNSIWEYIQTLYIMGEIIVNNDENMKKQLEVVYNNISTDELERFENNEVNELSNDFLSKINSS
jgi:hypothetical protein